MAIVRRCPNTHPAEARIFASGAALALLCIPVIVSNKHRNDVVEGSYSAIRARHPLGEKHPVTTRPSSFGQKLFLSLMAFRIAIALLPGTPYCVREARDAVREYIES
jgi:hypothetical protein